MSSTQNNDSEDGLPVNQNDKVIFSGGVLPYFRRSGRPSPFSMGDMNMLVKGINAFLGMRVTFTDAVIDPAGNIINSGKLVVGGNNSILELAIGKNAGTGTGTAAGIEQMTVQSWTSTNDYFSATRNDGSTVVNVALPWGLRQAQKPLGATLYPGAYTAGDIVYVATNLTGITGVTVSSSDLAFLDLNNDAKYWSTSNVCIQVQSWTTSNDYFSAKLYTFGTGATGSAFNVALPWEIRAAQKPGDDANAIVYPPYNASDILYAVNNPTGGTGVSSVTWLALANGKQWARKVPYKNASCTDTYRHVVTTQEGT